MYYFLYFLLLLGAFAMGFTVGKDKQLKKKTFGWLRIDKKTDRVRLELNNAIDLDELSDKYDYVILYVDPTADLPLRNQNNDPNEM